MQCSNLFSGGIVRTVKVIGVVSVLVARPAKVCPWYCTNWCGPEIPIALCNRGVCDPDDPLACRKMSDACKETCSELDNKGVKKEEPAKREFPLLLVILIALTCCCTAICLLCLFQRHYFLEAFRRGADSEYVRSYNISAKQKQDTGTIAARANEMFQIANMRPDTRWQDHDHDHSWQVDELGDIENGHHENLHGRIHRANSAHMHALPYHHHISNSVRKKSNSPRISNTSSTRRNSNSPRISNSSPRRSSIKQSEDHVHVTGHAVQIDADTRMVNGIYVDRYGNPCYVEPARTDNHHKKMSPRHHGRQDDMLRGAAGSDDASFCGNDDNEGAHHEYFRNSPMQLHKQWNKEHGRKNSGRSPGSPRHDSVEEKRSEKTHSPSNSPRTRRSNQDDSAHNEKNNGHHDTAPKKVSSPNGGSPREESKLRGSNSPSGSPRKRHSRKSNSPSDSPRNRHSGKSNSPSDSPHSPRRHSGKSNSPSDSPRKRHSRKSKSPSNSPRASGNEEEKKGPASGSPSNSPRKRNSPGRSCRNSKGSVGNEEEKKERGSSSPADSPGNRNSGRDDNVRTGRSKSPSNSPRKKESIRSNPRTENSPRKHHHGDHAHHHHHRNA